MRLAIQLLAAVLAVGFAPAPFPKPGANKLLQALQGEWIDQAQYDDGKPRIPFCDYVSEVVGDRLTIKGGVVVVSRWKINLDPREPTVMTLVGEGPDVDVGKVIKCRYRIDGDTLVEVWNMKVDGNPPDGFDPMVGVSVHVMKRKKP